MTPTLRDELMKMVEAAGKAHGGHRYADVTPQGPCGAVCRSEMVMAIGTRGHLVQLASKPYEMDAGAWLNEARYIAACSPERIKALAEVAMAAERIRAVQCDTTWNELNEALERLQKAVGT